MHEIDSFSREDGNDEVDKRDKIYLLMVMLVQVPKYTNILLLEHQDPVDNAGYSNSNSNLISSYSDRRDTNYKDSDSNNNRKEDEKVTAINKIVGPLDLRSGWSS